MKKTVFIVFVIFFKMSLYSQSYFIGSGKNSTSLKFTTQYSERKIPSDIGDSYEIGRAFVIDNKGRIDYETAITYDRYSPYVGAPDSQVNYTLNYLGIDNALLFSIINKQRFKFRLMASVNCKKLFFGAQSIEGKIYDIKLFPEFKGVIFMGTLGLQTKLNISDAIDLSLEYNRGRSFLNTGQNRNESLSVSSNQIMVGVHFKI